MPIYPRILVPIDATPCSAHAAAHAGELARALGSTVVLLFVLDTPKMLRDGVVDAVTLVDEATTNGREALARIASSLSGISVEQRTPEGDPAGEIARAAEDADLIVMGSHHRGLLGRVVLGSVTEAVLHFVARPVLVVPCPSPAGATGRAS